MAKLVDNSQFERFFAFLEEEGCREDFIQNLWEQRQCAAAGAKTEEMAHCYVGNYIIDMFPWNATIQGEEFWSGVNLRWNMLLQKIFFLK